MKIQNNEDIKLLMKGYALAAALNLALEKGLFWDLNDKKETFQVLSKRYDIPPHRCKQWLLLLENMGLLEYSDDTFTSSRITKNAIINEYSHETWSFLGKDEHDFYHSIVDLNEHISYPKSVLIPQNIEFKSYITKMEESKERAEKFCRLLFELHQQLAHDIAINVEYEDPKSLLDIGGGSGVISFKLLDKFEKLKSTVYDLENVCIAGRKIAEENGYSNRISYVAGNFLEDDLPTGFDMALECDVGIYSIELFAKVLKCLTQTGKFYILMITTEQGSAIHKPMHRPSLISSCTTFLSSLRTDHDIRSDTTELKSMLLDVGFKSVGIKEISEGMILLEASK